MKQKQKRSKPFSAKMNELSLSNAKAKQDKVGAIEFESGIDLGEETYFANDIDSKLKFEEL